MLIGRRNLGGHGRRALFAERARGSAMYAILCDRGYALNSLRAGGHAALSMQASFFRPLVMPLSLRMVVGLWPWRW